MSTAAAAATVVATRGSRPVNTELPKLQWVEAFRQNHPTSPHKLPVPRLFQRGQEGKGRLTEDAVLLWLSRGLDRKVTSAYVINWTSAGPDIVKFESHCSPSPFVDGCRIVVLCGGEKLDPSIAQRLPLPERPMDTVWSKFYAMRGGRSGGGKADDAKEGEEQMTDAEQRSLWLRATKKVQVALAFRTKRSESNMDLQSNSSYPASGAGATSDGSAMGNSPRDSPGDDSPRNSRGERERERANTGGSDLAEQKGSPRSPKSPRRRRQRKNKRAASRDPEMSEKTSGPSTQPLAMTGGMTRSCSIEIGANLPGVSPSRQPQAVWEPGDIRRNQGENQDSFESLADRCHTQNHRISVLDLAVSEDLLGTAAEVAGPPPPSTRSEMVEAAVQVGSPRTSEVGERVPVHDDLQMTPVMVDAQTSTPPWDWRRPLAGLHDPDPLETPPTTATSYESAAQAPRYNRVISSSVESAEENADVPATAGATLPGDEQRKMSLCSNGDVQAPAWLALSGEEVPATTPSKLQFRPGGGDGISLAKDVPITAEAPMQSQGAAVSRAKASPPQRTQPKTGGSVFCSPACRGRGHMSDEEEIGDVPTTRQ